MDSRTQRQAQCLERWLANKAQGSFVICTGFGKSYMAIQLAKKTIAKRSGAVVHLVVPTLFLKEQFEVALANEQLTSARVFVINTYVKEHRHCDLLIADEVHLYLNEHAALFSQLFTLSHRHWTLCLSASLTEEEEQRLEELGVPVVDRISLAEATREGWVAPSKTYNLAVVLTPNEQAEYDKAHKVFSQTFSKFGHDFQLALACVGNPKIRKQHALFMGWKETDDKKHQWSPTNIGAYANMWHQASLKRRDVVHHAAAKYAATTALIEKFNVPTICFSESTTFASHLQDLLPELVRAYHTKVPSQEETYTVTKTFKTKPNETISKKRVLGTHRVLQSALRDFRAHDHPVRVLSTARALDQGADFPQIRLGIETSGSGTIRQKVQRTGRVVRKDQLAPEDEQLALYVHIYCAGTYEHAKLKRKQGLTAVQEVTDIQDITF